MDFGALLHTAQKNGQLQKKEPVRYYSTKFEPPKKEQRNKQQLSENIKKFLAKKEAEEREKQLEAQRKKEELFALRAKDKKATRRVNVMLKRTKSANQSVLEEAVDKNNTSVTLAGPIQPDEDDYGYVSQEAAAFYNKMMEKYSKMPDEPKFTLDKKKKISTDLNSTRERVKAAIEREKEEANMPHRRKRKHKEEVNGVEEPEVNEVKEEQKPKPKSKVAAPPPINFNDLLKLAEKKQFEPIVIEQKPKEEERPLTKKQKKEMDREREWRERREGKLPPLPTLDRTPPKIPKLNGDRGQKVNGERKTIPKTMMNDSIKKISSDNNNKGTIVKSNEISKDKESIYKKPIINDKKQVPLQNVKPSSSSLMTERSKENELKKKEFAKPPNKEMPIKKFPLPDVKPKQLPPKHFPPKDLKPKQFPPPDVTRKDFPSKDLKKKPMVNKRRILDDDEEYDSEMDDFIDDGPEEGEDYSKYISEIFGYDKSKYRDIDEDVDNMESTFAQQMKEEVISTKIGIMEDLEDMKKEEEEKRRKALMKKRKL